MQLYKKVKGKYQKVNYSDDVSMPCEGIWSVYNRPGCKSESCIAFVGNFEPINYPQLGFLIKAKEDDCLKALDSVLSKSTYTRVELVRSILKEIVRM
jgi:hypothetical protein